MIRSYLLAKYTDKLDLSDIDLISLSGAPKDAVMAVIPILRDTTDMSRRWGFTSKLRAFNTGEIADEVHEFARGLFCQVN